MVSVISTLMLDVSHAVKVLVFISVCWWCKMPYICCIFKYRNCSCVSYLFLVSPHVVGIGSEYFVVLFVVCMYMLGWLCRATCYFVSTFQCLVYHLLSRWKEALEFTYRVIVKVLVLGLLVVVYEKIVSCEYDHLNGWNSTLNFASCMVHQTHSYNKRVFAKVRF